MDQFNINAFFKTVLFEALVQITERLLWNSLPETRVL